MNLLLPNVHVCVVSDVSMGVYATSQLTVDDLGGGAYTIVDRCCIQVIIFVEIRYIMRYHSHSLKSGSMVLSGPLFQASAGMTLITHSTYIHPPPPTHTHTKLNY